MIEIIKEKVEMPSLLMRRYQKIYKNNKHKVIDTYLNNKIIFESDFKTVTLACHNLNKKFYRDITLNRA